VRLAWPKRPKTVCSPSYADIRSPRSFGPAVFAGGKALSQLWLFIVAPIVGGVAAAIVWKFTGEDK